jgi:hypothetical protein
MRFHRLTGTHSRWTNRPLEPDFGDGFHPWQKPHRPRPGGQSLLPVHLGISSIGLLWILQRVLFPGCSLPRRKPMPTVQLQRLCGIARSCRTVINFVGESQDLTTTHLQTGMGWHPVVGDPVTEWALRWPWIGRVGQLVTCAPGLCWQKRLRKCTHWLNQRPPWHHGSSDASPGGFPCRTLRAVEDDGRSNYGRRRTQRGQAGLEG